MKTLQNVALAVYKGGREKIIAKVVQAEPLNEPVLAMPYRNRPAVHFVSIPSSGLEHARRAGCRLWVVRFDNRGECCALDLAEVEKAGSLQMFDGRPEWTVPLNRFEPIAWQDWPYTSQVHVLDQEPERPQAEQRALF